MLLSDRLFLIMHDEYSGRPRVSESTAGLGLAAGLLGELVLDQKLSVDDDGELTVCGGWSADPTGAQVLRLLLESPRYTSIRVWLPFLAGRSVELVRRRLAGAGWVRRERRGLLRVEVWPATDPNRSGFETVQLGRRLSDARESLELADRALAGLVAACGLTGHVLWDPVAHEVGRLRLPEVVASMPEPLRYLVAFAEAAIGEAVLARH